MKQEQCNIVSMTMKPVHIVLILNNISQVVGVLVVQFYRKPIVPDIQNADIHNERKYKVVNKKVGNQKTN